MTSMPFSAALAVSLAATVLWAVFPVAIALGAGSGAVSGGPGFAAALNLAGGAVCLLAGGSRSARRAVRSVLGTPRDVGLFLVNAVAIAVSNAFAYAAFVTGPDVTAALVLEGWPILAALILPLCVPGYTRWTTARLPALVLMIAAVLVLHPPGSGAPFAAFAFAVAAALMQVVTVVAHQRLVHGRLAELGGAGLIHLQGVRMLTAGAIAGAVAMIYDGDIVSALSVWVLLAGGLVAASAILTAVALEAARHPLLIAAWVAAPAITVVALAGLGLGTLTPSALLALACVIGAFVWDQIVTRRLVRARRG